MLVLYRDDWDSRGDHTPAGIPPHATSQIDTNRQRILNQSTVINFHVQKKSSVYVMSYGKPYFVPP